MFNNCANKYCGKFAQCNRFTGLCDSCNEEIFERIKAYINENGLPNYYTLSRDLKIPMDVIEGYIKDGRLEEIKKTYIENNPDVKMCPICGDTVEQEGLCKKCRTKQAIAQFQQSQTPNIDLNENKPRETWHTKRL